MRRAGAAGLWGAGPSWVAETCRPDAGPMCPGQHAPRPTAVPTLSVQATLVDSADAAAAAPYHAAATLEEGGEVAVGVARADGHKCSRCWNYRCVAAWFPAMACPALLRDTCAMACSLTLPPRLALLPSPRRRSTHVGQDAQHPELCERCLPVIQDLGFTLPQLEAVAP